MTGSAMLNELSIENVAVIEKAEVRFGAGLNVLTGETGEGGAQTEALQEALADRFYALEIRDQTRLAEDLWAREAEDSLRGVFLRDLKSRLDSARTEEERQRITMAARFGLAALDHRDLG